MKEIIVELEVEQNKIKRVGVNHRWVGVSFLLFLVLFIYLALLRSSISKLISVNSISHPTT